LKCSEYLKNYLEVETNVGLIKKKNNNKHKQNMTWKPFSKIKSVATISNSLRRRREN